MLRTLLFLLLLNLYQLAYAEQDAIYANADGTYTYYGQTYSFEDFPMDQVIAFNNKVQVFPQEGLSVEESLVVIRPLARKYIKAGYDVDTRLYGKVIPYLVQKKGQ